MRPLVSTALLLLAAVGPLACGQSGGGGDLEPPACLPDGVEVAPPRLDLVVDSTAFFAATVTASCASEPVSAAKVTFLSRDDGVATVASTSDITAAVTVHGNTITMGPGSLSAAGAVQDVGDNAIFTSRTIASRTMPTTFPWSAACSSGPTRSARTSNGWGSERCRWELQSVSAAAERV